MTFTQLFAGALGCAVVANTIAPALTPAGWAVIYVSAPSVLWLSVQLGVFDWAWAGTYALTIGGLAWAFRRAELEPEGRNS